MKKALIISFSAMLVIAIFTFLYKKWIASDSFDKEYAETEKFDEWAKREMNIMGTPITHKIPADARLNEIKAAEKIPLKGMFARGENVNSYVAAGPNNFGGRCRVVQYDIRFNGTTNQVLIAGGVNGGIFKSTDGGSTWVWKATTGYNSVTTIAQDPRGSANNPITNKPYSDTWYAGTGEFSPSSYANGAFLVGFGMYVSDDNGDTWKPMGFTQGTASGSPTNNIHTFDNAYDIINKIVVHPTTGVLYVSRYSSVLKITRNSTTYTSNTAFTRASVFLPYPANDMFTSNTFTDIAIKSDGSKIFLAWQGSDTATASWGTPGTLLKGVWESTTGNAGEWQKVGDPVIYPSWGSAVSQGRISIALAPSNQNIMYVLAENQIDQTSASPPEADLYKINMSTGGPGTYSFTNLSANIPNGTGQNFRGFQAQSGYNLSIAVKPDDPNFVVIGGTNAYRSTDGFATTTNVNSIGGYQYTNQSGFAYPNTHPDIHWFTFQPGNSSTILIASDGGIAKTTNVLQASPSYSSLNNNFQTYQFYFVSIDPTNGQNTFIGGAQDNSCVLRNGLSGTPDNYFSFLETIGGDGTSVGISSVNAGKKYVYLGTQNGQIRRCQLSLADNSVTVAPTSIKPTGSTSDFITYFYLNPDNTEDLYYTGYTGTSASPTPKLYRTSTASTVTTGSWTDMTGVSTSIGTGVLISSLATTRGAYTNSHNLFIGTADGRIFRVADPRNTSAATVPVEITPVGTASGNIIDIAVNPRNDDTLMAVVSNYKDEFGNDMPSIWVTGNAKSGLPTWTQVEGNIAPFSMRSCEIVVKSAGVEYYVGTSIGLYSTTALNSTSTVWVKEGAGTALENAVVSGLSLRTSDNTLLVGTHGNGMFYTSIGSVGTGVNDPVRNDKNFIKSIFPTLVTERINIRTGTLTSVKKLDIRIFNTTGQLLLRKEEGYRDLSVDISRLAAGSYFISIASGDYKYQTIEQFVKAR
ncbi:MAG: T9SS type A sorting domain-containing protein [Sphingobacteriales bacterium]|nr:T9SS type A sorting domain-containing protein [Sphingobacteriales bacterium]